jgi:hypothetical protein
LKAVESLTRTALQSSLGDGAWLEKVRKGVWLDVQYKSPACLKGNSMGLDIYVTNDRSATYSMRIQMGSLLSLGSLTFEGPRLEYLTDKEAKNPNAPQQFQFFVTALRDKLASILQETRETIYRQFFREFLRNSKSTSNASDCVKGAETPGCVALPWNYSEYFVFAAAKWELDARWTKIDSKVTTSLTSLEYYCTSDKHLAALGEKKVDWTLFRTSPDKFTLQLVSLDKIPDPAECEPLTKGLWKSVEEDANRAREVSGSVPAAGSRR